MGLQRGVAGQGISARRIERCRKPLGGEIGSPAGRDLAGRDHALEGAERLLRRCHLVVVVDVVEVDPLHAQAAEGIVHRPGEVSRGGIAVGEAAGRAGGAALGMDRHPVTVAALAHPVADDGFRLAAAVAGAPVGIDIRRVDGGQAALQRGVQQAFGSGGIQAPAEDIGAEDERRKGRRGHGSSWGCPAQVNPLPGRAEGEIAQGRPSPKAGLAAWPPHGFCRLPRASRPANPRPNKSMGWSIHARLL